MRRVILSIIAVFLESSCLLTFSQDTETLVQIMYRAQSEMIVSDSMARTSASMMDFLASRTAISRKFRESGIDSLENAARFFETKNISPEAEYPLFNAYFEDIAPELSIGNKEYVENIPELLPSPKKKVKLISSSEEPVSGGNMFVFKNAVRLVCKQVRNPAHIVYYSFFLRGESFENQRAGGVSWEDFQRYMLFLGIVMDRELNSTGIRYSGSCSPKSLPDVVRAVKTAGHGRSFLGGLIVLNGDISPAVACRVLSREVSDLNVEPSIYLDMGDGDRSFGITRVGDGEEGSGVRIEMSAPVNVNAERYMDFRLVGVMMKSELPSMIQGCRVDVDGHYELYPAEKFILDVDCQSEDGQDGLDILYAARKALSELKDKKLDRMQDYKNMLTGQITNEINDPDALALHLKARYVDGKDLLDRYQQNIKSISEDKIRQMIISLVEGGINEIVDR